MSRRGLHLFNAALLFLGASLHLGTGWSPVLFSFSVAPMLTVDNSWLQFVPQLAVATRVLTAVTFVMLASAAVLFWYERRTVLRWYPVLVFLVTLERWAVSRQRAAIPAREVRSGRGPMEALP